MSAALELLRAAQEGDRDACEQAVLENNGLIWSVVRRYYGRGVEPDDLYQLGCLGFLKAVKGFDFAYGTCFSTYAVPKIAGEIRRFLRDDGTIKVGRSVREQSLTLYTLRERLRQELGREPSLSELAERIGWTPEEIAQIDLATEKPDSLQRETAEGLALEGILGTEAPEDALVERIALREAVNQLPEKERMTILLRYFKGLTQERTAVCWGCLRYRSPGWSAGGWNGCGRCCRREIGCVLKFRHGIPVALGHIAHPQLGIFPFFDGNGVVKPLPQQPVVGLRFIRRSPSENLPADGSRPFQRHRTAPRGGCGHK